ncbi:MAG: 50S ribosomal protein L11 methyltransferase [Defluviitaleaceae bacterium]|nr:50S ribosomal protein L11 methyltransferase [Defluviitaleaceae bacterium]
MEWVKVEIHTTPFGAEVAMAILFECGVSGVEIINPRERVRHLHEAADSWDYAEAELLESADNDDVCVVFYAEKNVEGDALPKKVRSELARAEEICGAGAFRVREESAHESSWADEWKKHFKPLRAGRVLIVPEWEDAQPAQPADVIFKIDPGSAFGTGQHQSTRLCVLALQEYLRAGDAMLDIGCGSGILSVIGLLLGAKSVFACDIDPAGAIAATKKNASLNNIDASRLEVMAGDALSDDALRRLISAKKYEIVTANIVADVVIGLVPLLREVTAGVFIASGIIDERENDVLAAFAAGGLDVLQTEQLEGWCCIVGKVK